MTEALDPILAELTAPGQPFAVAERNGLRQFVNMPADLNALIDAARRHGDKTFLVEGERRLTFEQVFAWRDSLVPLLAVHRGERVAICMRNRAEWIVALMAVVKAGAIAVLMNSRGSPAELAAMIDEVTPALVIADSERAAQIRAGGWTGRLFDLTDPPNPLPLADPAAPLPAPVSPDDPAVILFTSGSEGVPKGVELTHANLLANIRQVDVTMDLTDSERFFNAMPLFHSFGLTACTLYPLVRGLYVFLYPSPLHYRMVPAAVYDRACTIMVGTNTFLNGYARKAHPYDFSTVKYLVAGAEKVQEATANIWARKFGVRLLEGYGATECSPAVCLNSRVDVKFGSVGRFMPGMEWRLEPVEGVAEGGRLFVRGPNIMKGYLNAEPNAAFLALNGWYDTGDMVRVDDEGFVFILGRLKRFAKVSGEMVSLTAVEDALAGAFPQFGLRCEIAVIAVHDEDKGEKLIAITNEPKLTLDDLRQVIRAKGLTNLCAPRELRAVHEIPKLGTGKVNHRALLEQLQAESKPAA